VLIFFVLLVCVCLNSAAFDFGLEVCIRDRKQGYGGCVLWCFFFLHLTCSCSCFCSCEQHSGQQFVAELTAHGIPNEYHIIPCTDHSSIQASFPSHAACTVCTAFVNKRLNELQEAEAADAGNKNSDPKRDPNSVVIWLPTAHDSANPSADRI
jgi:hypothetical protein